jgi:hypothetical protein
MTSTEAAVPRDLPSIHSALEAIETALCNYLSGDALEAPAATIDTLMDAAADHLRRLRSELRQAGMTGSLSHDDLPVFDETAGEVDDDPLVLPVGKVIDTLQALLCLIDELRDDAPDPAALNSRLLAIDHLAMMTLGRAEKCREIAAA